jgi:uncharacterized protein (TIGR02231 family)
MKKVIAFVFLLFSVMAYSQDTEKELKSKITEVTVFLNNAQITRLGNMQIPKGNSTVVLKGLSSYIDNSSIQVTAKGEFTILSVNYNLNYIQETARSKQINELLARIAVIDDSLNVNKAKSEVNKETLDLLNKNKKLGSETSGTDINQLKLAVAYYEKELTSLKAGEIQISKKNKALEEEKTRLNNQLNELNSRQNQPSGEISVRVQSDNVAEAEFRVSYLVANAGWTPVYDIRAKDVSSPIEMKYNANVFQNSGEDWDNVNLSLSNSNPNLSGSAPEIFPWYIGFIEPRPQMYETGAAMKSQEMKMDAGGAEEKPMAARTMEVSVVENQTSFNFKVNIPYSLKSNGNLLKVDLTTYSIPAEYQYYAAPKLDKDAFLIANITGWDKYNLLQGEASLYFENTYVGKSTINPDIQSDTMKISLGRDKSIVITRKKVDEFTQRKTIGANKVDTRGFVTSVRNNKSKPVNLIIVDQIPVSTRSEIVVNPLEVSGAISDKLTGILKWELQLNSLDQKDLKFQYEVKYPKNQRIILE